MSEPPPAPAAPPNLPSSPPARTPVTVTIEHRVGFHETDAMGIVHHANYLRFCENARVVWLETHDKSYPEWIASGLHFAVTRVDLEYKQPARFDDRINVTTWLEWVRGASLAMAYRIEREGTRLVSGWTEHASINDAGRIRRIPRQDRDRMGRLARLAAPPVRSRDETSP